MTVLLSWNIQYGKGVDGALDLGRVVATARAMGPFDVLCVQEVAVNFAEMGGGADVDQTAQLAALLPGYAPFFAPAVDLMGPNGARQRFGNMIFSRLPVLAAAAHLLPRPADPAVMHMPRGAAEVLVETRRGPLRVMTTHLEFHGLAQRLAQAKALRALYAAAAANDRRKPHPGPGPYRVLPPAIGTAICGDFNFEASEDSYAAIAGKFADDAEALIDAWAARYPGAPHAPTCGIFDREQWKQGPHARDFFFVSSGLAAQIESVEVDTRTAASDHQPVRLALED
ncbi:MAG: endonuclease/exonuclease/phosphatase family protein [Rhodospirillales bacterium]